MREILFRGKRADNGEWVEGAFSPYNWDIFGGREEKSQIIIFSEIEDFDGLWCEVLPETVGQYTGLTDKNGKKIFEGDIVHCVSRLDNANMIVIFEQGEFRMVLSEKYFEYQTGACYYNIYRFTKEVIGNIHDNPELLKGGENNETPH